MPESKSLGKDLKASRIS